MSFQKDLPGRDAAHLAYVRTLPCAACAAPPPSEASHHGAHGVATKPSDYGAIPLCRRCHDHWHRWSRVYARDGWSREKTRAWLALTAQRVYAGSPTRRVTR